MSGFLSSVPCPKCSAPVGEQCRSLTTDRKTDTHASRFDAYTRQTWPMTPKKDEE